jgi:CheY-like chemotaxis protein
LGLAIVWRLVELMGGSVRIESVLGQGALFIVQLELERSEAAEPEKQESPSVRPGLQVLLAEDNVVNQKVFTAMLTRLGCEVVLAGDGQQAIDIAQGSAAFDIILMDCQMPRVSGLEASSTLRSAGYEGPIVALTANVTPQDQRACIAAGMGGFLAKPLSMHALAVELGKL